MPTFLYDIDLQICEILYHLVVVCNPNLYKVIYANVYHSDRLGEFSLPLSPSKEYF